MDSASVVAAKLQIPSHYCHRLSPDRVVCLVTEEWVRQLCQGNMQHPMQDSSLDPVVAEKYLAKSCPTPPSPWIRLTVKVWPKSEHGIQSLWEGMTPYNQMGESLLDLMSTVAHDNQHNIWLATQQKYPTSHPAAQCYHHGHQHATSHHSHGHRSTEPLSDNMWHWIWRLLPNIHIQLSEDGGKRTTETIDSAKSANLQAILLQHSSVPLHVSHSQDSQLLHNVTRILAVVETDQLFLMIQPYVEYTLQDILSYSPSALETCYSKPLFILYQVLQAMAAMHAHGMPVGCVSSGTVLLDSDLWVWIVCPQKQALVAPGYSSGGTAADGHGDSLNVSQTDKNKQTAEDHHTAVGNKLERTAIASSKEVSNSIRTQESNTEPPSTYLSRKHNGSPTGENEEMYLEACKFLKQERYKLFSRNNFEELTEAWVQRHLSNFQYLMILNHLAGRHMNDPNNHPVLPWVMDFSSAHDGFRDLTKSKFRLNKGDSQLDFTYGIQTSYSNLLPDTEDSDHIPHHVSDVLSDITYYVYKARRMPKPILCSHVRSNWVPHEYPASMQRMQEWTPDECIPEFFTDPTIFRSIHSDLPDLDIPPWCSNTRDFVVRHMATLESERVSEQLHHWIDLTFGYKLSGKPAVAAKNVYLQLVDGHQNLRGHGIMQLFSLPHPHRLPHTQRPQTGPPRIIRELMHTRLRSVEEYEQAKAATDMSLEVVGDSVKPEYATIHLPHDYDPLAELEHCETVLNFKNKVLLLPKEEAQATQQQADAKSRLNSIVVQDIASFLCLVCEVFLAPKLRMQGAVPSLKQRLEKINTLCGGDYSAIPRPFQTAARLLSHLQVADSNSGEGGQRVFFTSAVLDSFPPPTPSLLLHPLSGILPFPPYFPRFYACMCHLKAIDEAMDEVRRGMDSPAEKTTMLKQFARSKVPVMENFLLTCRDQLGREGLQLVLPLIDSLLSDKLTTVQAAWVLFNIVSQMLGPNETASRFFPVLTALFSELPASAKHVKLYHRTFLTQLLLRLHLQPFLHHFATLLVEAVAGYKDFLLPSQFYQEELLEEMENAQEESQQADWLLGRAETYAERAQDRESNDDQGGGDEGDEGDGFVDGMSLEGDTEDLDFDVEGEDSTSLDAVSQESEAVDDQENSEEGVFDSGNENADQCSIHSISNILNARKGRRSTGAEEEDDKVFESPRSGNEGGMFKPASAASLASACSDQLEQEDVQTPVNADNNRTTSDGFPGADPKPSIGEPADLAQAHQKRLSGVTQPLKVDVDDTVSEGEGGSNVAAEEADSVDGSEQATGSSPGGLGLKGGIGRKSSESIRRSETEDLMSSLSLNSPNSLINIRHIASDSVKWLTHKLGPVLAARYLSRNLVRMLPLCYLGDSQLQPDTSSDTVVKTSRRVVGDGNAAKVLECIAFVATVYGENLIVIQYLPSIVDMVSVAQRRLTPRSESGLLGAVVLLRCVVPLLSDRTVMDVLQETIVADCISPLLLMLTSTSLSFPGGHLSRSVLCYKLVDLLYVLGLRLGLEMTRRFLHKPMLALMEAFTVVHAPDEASLSLSSSPGAVMGSGSQDESYITIKMDSATQQYTIGTPVNPATLSSSDPRGMSLSPGSSANRWHSLSAMSTVDERDECLSPRHDTAEKCRQELAAVFTPELALAAYIPLCRIFGSIHMEESLKNDDLIRQLCAQQDSSTDQPQPSPAQASSAEADTLTPTSEGGGEPEVSGGLGSNIEVVGNRIKLTDMQKDRRVPCSSPSMMQFGRGYRHDGILQIANDELRSAEMEVHKTRHLHGNWLQYWEHELGLHERDTLFNFKQIKLQTFTGHSNSIRAIMAMDTENCFISASKDKTVRLWALSSCGDGNSKVPCQWTYQQHKKSVFSVAYVESVRQVASCDSTVHVWDPFTGQSLCKLESSRYSPAVALQAIPAPSPLVLMGTTEATLRFLDLRTLKYVHEFRCSSSSTGLLRCVAVSPEGSWVAVGFSTGVISILELSSGVLQTSWKAHEGEILQIKAFSKYRLVSSSFDGTLKVWSVDGGVEICPLKGPSDSVHCFSFYRGQVLSATATNRIGVHSMVGENATFTNVKLRPDTFRGVLTSMAVLPLNRTLLLGSDNGTIQLLA